MSDQYILSSMKCSIRSYVRPTATPGLSRLFTHLFCSFGLAGYHLHIPDGDRLEGILGVGCLVCQGLRAADEGVGGNSDPYCMCEVSGKPLTRVKTKVIHDCQKPQWNEIHQISDYQEGDTLRFS
eukprot:6131826-Amphidinium_carterae.1